MNAGDIGAHAFGIAVITCMCSRRTPSLTLRSEGCVWLTKVCAELRRTTSNRAKTDASRSISCISGLHLVTFFACATFFPFWQPPPARLLRHITTGNRKHVLPVSVSDHRAENSPDIVASSMSNVCACNGPARITKAVVIDRADFIFLRCPRLNERISVSTVMFYLHEETSTHTCSAAGCAAHSVEHQRMHCNIGEETKLGSAELWR